MSSPTSSVVSSSESGSSWTTPAQAGRRSRSSGRAVQTIVSGSSAAKRHEVLDEVEQAVVGPVHVLEGEDDAAGRGQTLDEPPPGRERLAPAVAAQPLGASEADERPEVGLDPDARGRVVDSGGDGRAQLAPNRLRPCRSRGCRPGPSRSAANAEKLTPVP